MAVADMTYSSTWPCTAGARRTGVAGQCGGVANESQSYGWLYSILAGSSGING